MNIRRPIRFACLTLTVLSVSLFTLFYGNDNALTKSVNAILAPGITATKTGALDASSVPTPGDLNGNGLINPGDRLTYTITIPNDGPDAATGVNLSDKIDANTTLVNNSLVASPIAVNDSFLSIGNVGITIIDGASDLLSNDLDANNSGNASALVITKINNTDFTAPSTTVATANGSVKVYADGGFEYTPNAGFEGSGANADTFTYTLSNGTGLTDTSTVSINVSGMIWFINSALANNGNGTLSSPFNCLTGANCFSTNTLDKAGDNIFLYSSANNYTGGLTLLANQRLIGQGASASLSAITGINPPTGSNALPTTTTGANPVITSAAAGITLGTNNTIRGLTIGNTTGAKIAGSAFGVLTLGSNATPDVILNGTGQALSLTNGTFAATSALSSLTTTSSTTAGVSLVQVAGTVGFGSTTVSGSTTQGILVNQSTANINFGNTSVTGGTDGISLQNNSAGTRTFGTISRTNGTGVGFLHAVGGGTVSAGNVTITNPGGAGIDIQNSTTAITFANTTATLSAGTAMNLVGNSGALSFGDLDLSPDAGAVGLTAVSNTGSISTTSGTITTSGAVAVNIAGTSVAARTPLSMTLEDISATNSSGLGVNINFVSGNLTVAGADADVTVTNPTGIGLQIQNTGAGTINLGDAVVNSAASTSVNLVGNTGAIAFADFDIAPDAGQRALLAQNNTGTITSTSGTIATTNAVAVEITNATGTVPLNVQLTSVSANGGANGIVLTNTSSAGSPGGFSVLGNGATSGGFLVRNGTGGTINGTSSHSVSLSNANKVTLRQMNITNTAGGGTCPGTCTSNGVNSLNSSNIVLSAVNLQNLGGHGWYGINLSGTNRFDNNGKVENWQTVNTRGIYIENTNTNFTSFTVDRSLFTTSATGADGFLFDGEGATSGIVTVTDSEFTLLDDDGLQINNDGSGNITAIVKRNNFHDADATSGDGNNTLFLANAGSGTLNFTVGADANADLASNPTLDRNTFKNLARVQVLTGMVAVNAATVNRNGTRLNGTIRNNVITNDAGFDSRRDGISFGIEANGGSHGSHKILVADNTISRVGLMGMRVLLNSTNDVAGGSLPDTNLTIRNNSISNVGISPLVTDDSRNGIEIEPNFSNFSNGGDMGTNLLLQANTITNSSASGVGDTVEVIARGGDAGTNHTMNLTMLGNNLTNTNGTSVVDVYTSTNTSTNPPLTGTGVTLNVDMNSDNILANANNTTNNAGAAGSIQLRNNISGALYRVENLGGNPANTFVSQRNNNDTVSVSGTIGSTGAVTIPQLPDSFLIADAQLVKESANQLALNFDEHQNFRNAAYKLLSEIATTNELFDKHSTDAETIFNYEIAQSELTATARETAEAQSPLASDANEAIKVKETGYWNTFTAFAGELADKAGSAMMPTVAAQISEKTTLPNEQLAPESGETVTKSLGTIPAGEQVVVRFKVTVDANIPANDYSISNQATISGSNFSNVLTDGDAVEDGSQATITNVVQPPFISKAFGTPNIAVNGVTSLTFTVTNGNVGQTYTELAFTDTLPDGLIINTPNGRTNTCGGDVTAVENTKLIRLLDGSLTGPTTVGTTTTCTVKVDVKGTADGAQNSVSGAISSLQGGTGSTASATLNVIAAPSFTKAFGAAEIQMNSSTTLTFTITNNSSLPLSNVSFTDNLPDGLVVAATPGVTGSCGSGTITANAGSSSISLSGAAMPANSICTIGVNVRGTSLGFKSNSVSLSTAELGTGAVAATASITVIEPTYTMAGTVIYGTTPTGDAAQYVPGVLMTAAGTPQAAVTTDSLGKYLLSGLGSGPYTVTPTKSGDVNDAVSSFDAALAARYAGGLITLSPNQITAADVSGNGEVSSYDAALIARTAGLIPNVGSGGQWRFLQPSTTYPSLSESKTGQDYQAILMGDVSGDWKPAASPNQTLTEADKAAAVANEAAAYQYIPADADAERQGKEQYEDQNKAATEAAVGAITVDIPDNVTAANGATVLVPINLNEDVTGQGIISYAFTVSFNAAVLEPADPAFETANTRSGASGFNISPNTATNGQINIQAFSNTQDLSGSGTLLFLRFKVIGAAGATTNLTFNSFRFNEGTPSAMPTGGVFTVSAAPPTAASVSVAGRVTTAQGRGITNVVVMMIDSQGRERAAQTSSFGYYRFDEVAAGETVTLKVRSKRYRFGQSTIVRTTNESISDANFVSEQ